MRCPQNQTFDKCGSDCGHRCSDLDQSPVCKNTCKRGCFCSTEFFRDDYTGRCILPNECILYENPVLDSTTTPQIYENLETTIITEYYDNDYYETTTTTAKTFYKYIIKCPNGMKYFKCSDCSAACHALKRKYIRDKRSVFKSSPRRNVLSDGKCLLPQQCDFDFVETTESITYEVEKFN